MAIRIRKVDGELVALCAAKTEAQFQSLLSSFVLPLVIRLLHILGEHNQNNLHNYCIVCSFPKRIKKVQGNSNML